MREERYLALDGMRGIAAIAVALMHARLAALHGYLAVDLFFLLSGFVIAKSYEPKLASGEMGFAHYARVRFERLYPMLFLGSLLGVAAFGLGWSHFQPVDAADFGWALASQFLLIPLLASSTGIFAFNNPQWSIVWELAANFAHALGLRRLSNRVLAGIIALSALGLVMIALRAPSLSTGWSKDTWLDGLPRVSFGFFGGILLYRTRELWLKFVPRVSLALPALLFFVAVNMPPQMVPGGRLFALYDCFLVIALFVPIIMLSVKATAGRFASALGALSYPLYAINEPVLSHLDRAGFGNPVKLAALATMVLAAWAIGRWIDEPLNAVFRRWRRGPRAGSVQAAVA